MHFIRSHRLSLSARHLVGTVALAALLAACGSTAESTTLEDLGLAVTADVQQGASFEVGVPVIAGTTISIASSPAGVAAVIAEGADGTLRLSLAVEPDTPAGSYNVGLEVTRNGQEQLLGFPFEVIAADEPVVTDPSASAFTSPEALRDALVEALRVEDPSSARALWPTESWSALGSTVVGSFVPAVPEGTCERIGESSAHCFVFAQDDPFVLGLTMERQGLDTWVITSIGYDSTN